MIAHYRSDIAFRSVKSLSLEVVDDVFPQALDLHLFLLVLLRAKRVLDEELMEGAIFGRILEHSFLLLSDEVHHVVELHQHSSVRNCEDMLLLLSIQVLVVDDVLLDQKFHELAASLVNVHPALAFLALVGSKVLALLIGHLLPCPQRFPLQNASAFLSDQTGVSSGDFLKVMSFEFDVVKGGLGPAQIRDVDVIKVDGMFVEEDSYFLGLFLP